MNRLRFLSSIVAVLAILLICSGAAVAADTIDFSSGSATLPLDAIKISDGDTLKVNVDISDLAIEQDGTPLTVDIGGIHDILSDITLDSFKVKFTSEGIDAVNSPISIGLAFFTIPTGKSLADFSKGITITKNLEVPLLGKAIDQLPNLYSMTIDVLPSAKPSSIAMDIDAKINTGATIQPNIKISNVDISRLKADPKITLTLTSGQNTISKTYTLAVSKQATPTKVPTTQNTNVPTQTPASKPTPIPETPAPMFGILAALITIGSLCILKRK